MNQCKTQDPDQGPLSAVKYRDRFYSSDPVIFRINEIVDCKVCKRPGIEKKDIEKHRPVRQPVAEITCYRKKSEVHPSYKLGNGKALVFSFDLIEIFKNT